LTTRVAAWSYLHVSTTTTDQEVTMQFPTTYRHRISGELFVATGTGAFGARSVDGVWVADGRPGSIWPTDTLGAWKETAWVEVDPAAEITRLEAYLAGQAGGTATTADVLRWTGQVAALRKVADVAGGATPPPACYACEWDLRSHQHIGCDRDPARTAPRSIVTRPADHKAGVR
jgi:hypothetical protein